MEYRTYKFDLNVANYLGWQEKVLNFWQRVWNTLVLVFWLLVLFSAEAVVPRYSVEKVFLEISQNLQENTCATISFLIKLPASDREKKGTLAQVFSSEFCEISKNTFFYRTPPVAAFVSDYLIICFKIVTAQYSSTK